jgi:hypothetical protein
MIEKQQYRLGSSERHIKDPPLSEFHAMLAATSTWHGLKSSLASLGLMYLPCLALGAGLMARAVAESKLFRVLGPGIWGESCPWDVWLLSVLAESTLEAARGLSVALDPLVALGAAFILCSRARPDASSWLGTVSRRESSGDLLLRIREVFVPGSFRDALLLVLTVVAHMATGLTSASLSSHVLGADVAAQFSVSLLPAVLLHVLGRKDAEVKQIIVLLSRVAMWLPVSNHMIALLSC